MNQAPTSSGNHWTQRQEGGGRFAIWLIRTIVLRMGRPLGRVLLYPITAYFLLRRHKERAASQAFLRRALGREPRLRDSFRHIHSFAATILDRPLFLTGRLQEFDVRVEGLDDLHRQMDLGRGVLMLGSHLGSFEVMRVLAEYNRDIEVAILLDRQRNPAMTQLLEQLNPRLAAAVIDAAQPSTDLMLKIGEAAGRGALIGILGDRRRPGDPGVRVPFLGEPAGFPTAPYLIASALELPVCLCTGLYQGGRRYDLHFQPLTDGLRIPRAQRRQQLGALVAEYVGWLEGHARAAPWNWFNFYDFWQDDATDPLADPDPGRADAGADIRTGADDRGGGAPG